MQARNEESYEDLLGLWSDLEAALSVLLSEPLRMPGFTLKLQQIDLWLQDLISHDTDVALYLMFQRASSTTVGYSPSHALVCASLCHVLSKVLQLPQSERDTLILAALTMNIGMTALQNQLAEQREPLSPLQSDKVKLHPTEGRVLLEHLLVRDTLWLKVVQHHHEIPPPAPLAQLQPVQRLVRILGTVDRYAALISPRKTRSGRSAAESLQILQQDQQYADEVKQALTEVVGSYPPGTYVQLDNGEIAVVLRRGPSPAEPQIASVIDADGHGLYPPILHMADRRPQIRSALARSSLTLDLDLRSMAQLGVHSARGSAALYRMVKLPGSRVLSNS